MRRLWKWVEHKWYPTPLTIMLLIMSHQSFASPIQPTHIDSSGIMRNEPNNVSVLEAIKFTTELPPENMTGKCEQDFQISEKLSLNCVRKNDGSYFAYIKNAQGDTLQLNTFLPIAMLRLGNRSGVYLYSDSYVTNLIVGFDAKGRISDIYVLDGEPLLDKNKIRPLHKNFLVWYSYRLSDNPCVKDFLKNRGKLPGDLVNDLAVKFSSLYKHVPIQINVISLLQHIDHLKYSELLDTEIVRTLNYVVPLVKSNPEENEDFSDRLFVFLAANSSDKFHLEKYIASYIAYINKQTLRIYNKTSSCH